MSRIGNFRDGVQEFDNEAEAKACAEMLGLCISYKHGIFFVYPKSKTDAVCKRYEMLYSKRFDCLIDRKDLYMADGDFSNYQLPYRVTDLSDFMELRLGDVRKPPKIPDWVTNTSRLFCLAKNLEEPVILPPSVKQYDRMYSEGGIVESRYRTLDPVRLSLMKQRGMVGVKPR